MKENLGHWKYLDFDDLIHHGKENGANIVNGMPWSWKINGKTVTHERDDLYLIECIDGMVRFEKGDMIRAEKDGLRYISYEGHLTHAPGSCPL